MLAWADTVLVRLLSGLGLLLLTAAQPKALTWHHAQQGDPEPAPGKHVAGDDAAASADPLTPPAEKKQREPLTLAATLPQTMSPRSPVGTVSEAERQAGDGKPRTRFADGPEPGSMAAIIADAAFARPPATLAAPVAVDRPLLPNLARRLLCVISPAGPPRV